MANSLLHLWNYIYTRAKIKKAICHLWNCRFFPLLIFQQIVKIGKYILTWGEYILLVCLLCFIDIGTQNGNHLEITRIKESCSYGCLDKFRWWIGLFPAKRHENKFLAFTHTSLNVEKLKKNCISLLLNKSPKKASRFQLILSTFANLGKASNYLEDFQTSVLSSSRKSQKARQGFIAKRLNSTKRPLRCSCDKNMQKWRVFHRFHYWLRKSDFNNTCQFWLVHIISHTILATIFTTNNMRGRQNYWMLLGWDRGHFFPNHEKIRVKIYVK